MASNRYFHNILFFSILIAVISLSLLGCEREQESCVELDEAERVMVRHPDSSLLIINQIDTGLIKSDRMKARYALLKSMALDKNCIDTPTFKVIQPALDYYLKNDNGNGDEKVRTLYYQGRIYENKGNNDSAMAVFAKAHDISDWKKDTLTYANLLVAQAVLYFKIYDMDNFIKYHLDAAELYKAMGHKSFQIKSVLNALDGAIIKEDGVLADSLRILAKTEIGNDEDFTEEFAMYNMNYINTFGTKQQIAETLDDMLKLEYLSEETRLDMTLGYLKIGENEKALAIFNTIDPECDIAKDFKYLAVSPDVLEANGDYKGAIQAYRRFAAKHDTQNYAIFKNELIFAQKKHDLMIANANALRNKDKILYWAIIIIMLLIIAGAFIYWRLRFIKMRQLLIAKENEELLLREENLRKEKDILSSEKAKAQLECENQMIANENLRFQIDGLESERESLNELLLNQEKLSEKLEGIIKDRIEVLNHYIAFEITKNPNYSKKHTEFVKKIHDDKQSFMNSTRIAFEVSHRDFIKHLKDYDLSDEEINYICLYALGLRGKEIGEYLGDKRHYHMSSDIRKKLGLDEHDTNLSIYVRRLMAQLSKPKMA